MFFVNNFISCVPFSQKFTVGLNFANEGEARQFHKAVDAKVNERQQKRDSEFEHTTFRNSLIVLWL